LIVIGGGPGGYVSAIRGAQEGFRVALADAGGLGGTCLNRGCIPTKFILHVANIYREMVHGEDLGIKAQGISYDLEKLHKRKAEIVTKLRDGVAGLLKANAVDTFSGFGKITDPGKVTIIGPTPQQLEGKRILIAVGASPILPNIPGVHLPDVITSDALLEGTPRAIKHLVIIGGGVIGVEMTSIYANFGTKVTVIEAADRILPLLDSEIGQSLSMLLKKRGATIHTAAKVTEISQSQSGLVVSFTGKTGDASVECDTVLMAIGRAPRLDSLIGEGVDIHTNRGIVVNDKFETSVQGIYAVGDCVSGTTQLAHVAHAQATNAVCLMAGKNPEMDLTIIPNCIYTDPEIATVGLSADAAKKAGVDVKTSKYLMSGHGKSMLEGHERGFVKLVFSTEDEVIVGAQLMCGSATDMIGELEAAIEGKYTAKKLSAIIHPHPSFSEGIGEAVENLHGKAVHVVPAKTARR
jgi:dihydrolipoamide dehydrogenase